MPDIVTYPDALEIEREMLLATLRDQAQRFSVWRTGQALIVPRGMPGRPGFDGAKSRAERNGWPVFERDTGGDLTPQGPGIVNLTLAFHMGGPRPSIEEAYRRLTAPVLAFLAAGFAIAAETMSVPGAFCDGAYNIAAGGRKLGGTAQRWRLLGSDADAKGSCVLAHVALLADIDLAPGLVVINDFYADLGLERRVDIDRHVTLRGLAGPEQGEAKSVAHKLSTFMNERPDGPPAQP